MTTRYVELRSVVKVLIIAAVIALPAAATGVAVWAYSASYRVERARIERVDRFCDTKIRELRTRAQTIRDMKFRLGEDYVQNVMVDVDTWTYFQLCTSERTTKAFDEDWKQCALPEKLRCDHAALLERLADAIAKEANGH